jgi:hypothetical protein
MEATAPQSPLWAIGDGDEQRPNNKRLVGCFPGMREANGQQMIFRVLP